MNSFLQYFKNKKTTTFENERIKKSFEKERKKTINKIFNANIIGLHYIEARKKVHPVNLHPREINSVNYPHLQRHSSNRCNVAINDGKIVKIIDFK